MRCSRDPDPAGAVAAVKVVSSAFDGLRGLDRAALLMQRWQRFRKLGRFAEAA